MLRVLLSLVAAFLISLSTPGVRANAAGADVHVTQKYLVPLCLDGRAVGRGERRWTLSAGEHTLAFTMRDAPRDGTVLEAVPGVAVIHFPLVADHRYEVEVRAPSQTFAARVWVAGRWAPVVRDRTVDRIVSDEPTWKAPTSGRKGECPAWHQEDSRPLRGAR